MTSEAERGWPGHFWLVAPVMFGGASLVGVSRMYHDKHWASDVVLGAAVGTFSGLEGGALRPRPSKQFPRSRDPARAGSAAPDGSGPRVSFVVPLRIR